MSKRAGSFLSKLNTPAFMVGAPGALVVPRDVGIIAEAGVLLGLVIARQFNPAQLKAVQLLGETHWACSVVLAKRMGAHGVICSPERAQRWIRELDAGGPGPQVVAWLGMAD